MPKAYLNRKFRNDFLLQKKHPFLVENDGDSESSGYEQEGAGEPQANDLLKEKLKSVLTEFHFPAMALHSAPPAFRSSLNQLGDLLRPVDRLHSVT